MLARGEAVRPAIPPEPPKEGPTADELSIPAEVLDAASSTKLVALVQQSQTQRINVAQKFEDVFEILVTGGRADEYTALCDRFSTRFGALSRNLEMCAARLSGEPALATMVQDVNASEAKRLELQMELQVVRQRLSLAEVESEDAAGGKQRVTALEGELKALTGQIYESLEELRCEAADLED